RTRLANPPQRLDVPLEVEPVHADGWLAGDAVHERPLFHHQAQQLPLALRVEEFRVELPPAEERHAGRQAVGAPVAHAGNDQVIRPHPAGDEAAAGDVAADRVPGDFAHADLVAAVADADGRDAEPRQLA